MTTKPEKPFQITQRLLNAAIQAVNELSVHLQHVPDKPMMYKANQALHKLWEIERDERD